MIVGAGLAGLIAAHALPRHSIVEAQDEPTATHKALLRFRSAAVGELTGIEFKPVSVHKGIWFEGGFQQPTIRAANFYSRKVLGQMLDRSIWKLEPSTRYVAPEDFYERLIDSVGHRISWGTKADYKAGGEPIISTAPMPIVLREVGIDLGETFHRAAIAVERFHVPRASIYQTVYFPTMEHSMYRASMTGDLLICEFAGEPRGPWMTELYDAFALPDNVDQIESVTQNYGKIAPIDNGKRKAVIAQLTADHNVFSLGRFATWRNILLDDVVHDIAVVKRLLNATHYERRLASL